MKVLANAIAASASASASASPASASSSRHHRHLLPLLLSPSSSLSYPSSFSPHHPHPLLSQRIRRPPSRCRPSHFVALAAMAAAEPVEVLVKAAVGEPEKIGDCPFSQRVLLTLEEKGVAYNAKYVDLTNKPDWFLEINPEGKVPVIKHDGKWVPDSDVITGILEEKFPEPPLKTPEEKASIGSKIFPSFVKFLKSKDPSDGSEEALVFELSAFDDYLKDNGPFIHGEKITASDLSLAPKLFHLEVALGHYKKWALPSNLTNLKNYIEALHTRESFVKTKPEPEHVVAGWQKHVS